MHTHQIIAHTCTRMQIYTLEKLRHVNLHTHSVFAKNTLYTCTQTQYSHAHVTHTDTHTHVHTRRHTTNTDKCDNHKQSRPTSRWQCIHHFLSKLLHSWKAICCTGDITIYPQCVHSGVLLQVFQQDILCVLIICSLNGCSNI